MILKTQTLVARPEDKQHIVSVERSVGVNGRAEYNTKYACNRRSIATTITFSAKLWFRWFVAIRWSIYKGE